MESRRRGELSFEAGMSLESIAIDVLALLDKSGQA